VCDRYIDPTLGSPGSLDGEDRWIVGTGEDGRGDCILFDRAVVFDRLMRATGKPGKRNT